jgi:hypothetical protein
MVLLLTAPLLAKVGVGGMTLRGWECVRASCVGFVHVWLCNCTNQWSLQPLLLPLLLLL